MADALPTPMVMRFMCARNVFCLRVCACVYLLLFVCLCVFLFSCRFFSRSHAQVVVLVKIIHRHYSAITLVKALAHSTIDEDDGGGVDEIRSWWIYKNNCFLIRNWFNFICGLKKRNEHIGISLVCSDTNFIKSVHTHSLTQTRAFTTNAAYEADM